MYARDTKSLAVFTHIWSIHASYNSPPNTVLDIKALDTTVKRLMSRSCRRLDKDSSEFFFFIIIIPALKNITHHFHFGHHVQQNEIKHFYVNGTSGSLMALFHVWTLMHRCHSNKSSSWLRAGAILQNNVPSYDHCVDLQMEKRTSIAKPSSLSTVSTKVHADHLELLMNLN